MMRKSHHQAVIISGILLSLLLAGAPQVFAEKDFDKDYDEEGWEEKVNKMHDDLGLTSEQREALRSNKEKHRGDMKALREDIKTKQDQLREEMQKSDFDAGRVRMLNDEIKRLHNEMADQRLEGILDVREILTPEQYSRFQEMKESRREKFQERREGGRGEFRERIRDRIKERRDE